MSPSCTHVLANGEQCNAPAINNCSSCRHHDPNRPCKCAKSTRHESQPLEFPVLRDKVAILTAVIEVIHAVSERRIKRSEGGTLLYGLQFASSLMTEILEAGSDAFSSSEVDRSTQPAEPSSQPAQPSEPAMAQESEAAADEEDFYRPTPEDDAEFMAIFETGNIDKLTDRIAAKREAWESKRAMTS